MGNVVLIRDLIDAKKRKEKELAFYKEKLVELEGKLALLRHEINLTNKILAMIKKEELVEIG